MRLLLATMSHETNTFSPVPTGLSRFCRDGTTLLTAEQAIAFFRGTGTCLGGFLAVAEAAGAKVVVPVAAAAAPSSRVDRDAYERICTMVTDAVALGGFDGIMLDLHGAMAVDGFDDGEGELLRRIRAIDPATPIAVAYDMHANMFPAMVENATIVARYHTYPHVDMAETARLAGEALLRTIRGVVRPVTAWGQAPMLPHVMAQGTHAYPNRELQAMCIGWEASGRALAASLFVGFPHADVAQAGLSAVVVTDGNAADAQVMVDELLAFAWNARRDFEFKVFPLADSVAHARRLGGADVGSGGTVVMLDHYDNCASGGTMDTTDTLAEIIRQELDGVVFFGIYDPGAVQQAIAAGIGAQIELDIGGKMAMPELAVGSHPLRVAGMVRTISAGYFTATAGLSPGLKMFMGDTVVLDTGRVQIVLLSRHVEPTAADMLRVLGIEPSGVKYLAIKSRVHWRADLGRFARHIVECAGVGVCTSQYEQLTFRKVRRPIYPLDPQIAWNAGAR